MKRLLKIGVLGGVLAVALAVFASGIVTFSVGTSAEPAAAEVVRDGERSRPSLVAVAIGQLVEDDASDMTATVSLQAAIRDGEAGGNLRFFCEEVGY